MASPQPSANHGESIEEFDRAIAKVEALSTGLVQAAGNIETFLADLKRAKVEFEKACGELKTLTEEYDEMKSARDELAEAIMDYEHFLDSCMRSSTKDPELLEATKLQGELQALLKQRQELHDNMNSKMQALRPAQAKLELSQEAMEGFSWLMGNSSVGHEGFGALTGYVTYFNEFIVSGCMDSESGSRKEIKKELKEESG